MKRTLILLIVWCFSSSTNSFGGDIYLFKEITLSVQPSERSTIYKYTDNIFFEFGFQKEPYENYKSQKFILLRKTDQQYTPICKSEGSGDSYILSPKFYRADYSN